MTSAELIAKIKEADPSGELEVAFLTVTVEQSKQVISDVEIGPADYGQFLVLS